MKRTQLNNKAREVPWLAIPNRYWCFKSTNCTGLDRGIVSIPYRHCTDNPIIPDLIKHHWGDSSLIAVLTFLRYTRKRTK